MGKTNLSLQAYWPDNRKPDPKSGKLVLEPYTGDWKHGERSLNPKEDEWREQRENEKRSARQFRRKQGRSGRPRKADVQSDDEVSTVEASLLESR